MSLSDSDPGSADQFVRAGVEAAALLRRRRAAARRRWRMAPWMGAGCLCVAAAARSFHWPAALPLAGLSCAAAIVLALGVASRRGAATGDPEAAAIDADAGLGGELRSASWFAGRTQHEAWADYHVWRAADRLRALSWPRLYPPVRARRAQLITAALAAGTLALSLAPAPSAGFGPGARSGPATPAHSSSEARAEVSLPELQDQLEALLVSAETGAPPPASAQASAAGRRRLIAGLEALRQAGKLGDFARAMTSRAGERATEPGGELKALAGRIQEAAQRPAVTPDVRDTLEKVSEALSEDGGRIGSPKEPSQNAGSSRDGKGDMVRGRGRGQVDESAIQSLSESDGGGAAAAMMAAGQGDESKKKSPGLGLGGSSDAPPGGGTMSDLEAALRRATIEAGTDGLGETIQTDVRRNTDRGTAAATYTHSAAGTFDRGQAVAPPAVPEGRRAAVQTYFIRKQ